MRLRTRTFEQLGPYLLLRKIESDKFCETWRVRPEGSTSELEFLALRRFPSIDHATFSETAARASRILDGLSGPSIARRQRVETIDREAVLVHEYEGGRSLAHVIDRSRNSASGRTPLPEDLALTIMERILLALVATHEFRPEEMQTVHGGLVPHLVWLTADGEVRLVGQELGRAAVEALRTDAAPIVRPFLAPEVVLGGDPTEASDVYSAGALLYLVMTGEPPPECRTSEQNVGRIQGARSCLSGDPLPADVQTILVRALSPEPGLRFQSAAEMREVITKKLRAHDSGPTTFNLAFFLHTLLRKEFEAEQGDRERELSAGSETREPAGVAGGTGVRKGLLAAAVLAAVLVISVVAAAYIRFSPVQPSADSNAPQVSASPAPRPAAAPSSPIAAASVSPDGNTLTDVDDAAAKERAFEEAVNARLQSEMAKLQIAHDQELLRQRQRAADVRSQESARREEATAGGARTGSTEPTREGQLVELSRVDQEPVVVRSVQPSYPQEAISRRVEGNVIVSALVSETGRVLDVRVMRGDDRQAGLDEAASAAVREWQFTPAVKDGQRVRTWAPVAITFRLPE